VGRPRSFGPPLQTRRFPSLSVASPRSSSFLGRSASDLRRTPALGGRSLAKKVRSRQKSLRAGTTTREGLSFNALEILSRWVWNKTLAAGQPGHPRLDQFFDRVIISQMFRSTWPQMNCDLVLKSRQSVLRTLVLVPLVFVFLFGSAKIGVSAIPCTHMSRILSDILGHRLLQIRWCAFGHLGRTLTECPHAETTTEAQEISARESSPMCGEYIRLQLTSESASPRLPLF